MCDRAALAQLLSPGSAPAAMSDVCASKSRKHGDQHHTVQPTPPLEPPYGCQRNPSTANCTNTLSSGIGDNTHGTEADKADMEMETEMRLPHYHPRGRTSRFTCAAGLGSLEVCGRGILELQTCEPQWDFIRTHGHGRGRSAGDSSTAGGTRSSSTGPNPTLSGTGPP
ncbi:hypothetical protein VOLCADRAFT_86403 [Volvox carteri f. nagariensis]|uniref:Uncharacterized protein n=1 Tax=Volvox carteri f. nagariensis TaxID=3068 RepID=D8TIP2_VOLCA|nr:uncharacterized protein VOLCADRAFT_86403 [Volvox carteri f. nagariensis]EFJ53278.1 hypothetical protein VOLCADRAFT_86403 [Volvox carteri f. nagariensis]|eukprot:XP_002946283.1 hypothetical protein VOLCADRAFT_86403 [Volvox carteri f. nagariensis]